MKVMSYNTLFAGFDGSNDTRYQSQMNVIADVAPDVLLMQEARNFTATGSALHYLTEARLGMRGFVAEAPFTGQHTAIFVRPQITPISFEADATHFHHSAAFLKMAVPGFAKPVRAVSVHLCPNSPEVRLKEAVYLFNLANPDEFVLVAGDFNSVSPDDLEPEGMDELPTRFRMRYTDHDGRANRETVRALLRSGFADVALTFPRGGDPTVPADGFPTTEFVPFRSDYILATSALVATVCDYGVLKDGRTDFASDHYPIYAEFRGRR